MAILALVLPVLPVTAINLTSACEAKNSRTNNGIFFSNDRRNIYSSYHKRLAETNASRRNSKTELLRAHPGHVENVFVFQLASIGDAPMRTSSLVIMHQLSQKHKHYFCFVYSGKTFPARATAISTAKPHIIDGMPVMVDGSMILTNVVGTMNNT